MAEEGGDGDAALQGGGLPGTLHWTGDCQEREILGPLRGPVPGVGTLCCALGALLPPHPRPAREASCLRDSLFREAADFFSVVLVMFSS